MSDSNKVQGHGSTFRVCHAHLKNAILLHSSLVVGVSFFPRLYQLKGGQDYEQMFPTERPTLQIFLQYPILLTVVLHFRQ